MGFGLFWKERGPTSQSELGRIKQKLNLKGPSRKGIGHGGTLDPFAEGWLLVGWGEGSKLLGALKGLSKTYIAEIYLGASTETFDDTVVFQEWNIPLTQCEDPQFENKLKDFLKTKLGPQMQKPPLYSAKKVDGHASYELIRRGIEVDLKEVPVEIFEAEHLRLEKVDDFHFKWTVKVRVSAGTYVRCLARDWAMELFSKPALLTKLSRVGYGSFMESSSTESKIMEETKDLSAFFNFISENKIPTERVKDRGHLLLNTDGSLQAAWLIDSDRWRYFNSNPLK